MPTHTIHGERGGPPQKNVSYDVCVCVWRNYNEIGVRAPNECNDDYIKNSVVSVCFFLGQMLGHHGNAFAARIPILW